MKFTICIRPGQMLANSTSDCFQVSKMSTVVSQSILFSLLLVLGLFIHMTESRLISKFGNCPELNNYYINKVLPLVGPFGLNSRNVYTRTRSPERQPDDPGTQGGPAGLPLRRPFGEPKFISFSNLTSGFDVDGDTTENGLIAGIDFSGTNVQVKGVDEPDIIKTDGKRVFTISRRTFSVVEVRKGGAKGKRVGKLMLPTFPKEMLIEGDWVLVLGNTFDYKRSMYQRFEKDPSNGEDATVVYQIKITRGKPRVVSTLHLEGRYISSREVDGIARLVLRFKPLTSLWLYRQGKGIPKATIEKWNREIIQYSRPGNWLPTYVLRIGKRVQQGVYAACGDVYYSPKTFSGFDILTVVTLPVNGLLSPTSSASVVSNVKRVYSRKTVMYVSTSEIQFNDISNNDARWGRDYTTSFHKFNLTDEGAFYVASGSVAGSVINQFAMHENRGTFFVATTEGANWWSNRDTSKSKVSAFVPDEKTRTFRKVGEVGNLGVGEKIFAVRYISDTAYVVTFREIDPLYIIDLSEPTKLRVTGELKIPGFSSYLHYVAPGRILGVGRDATLTGLTTGAKVSLFDVSDKSNPVELSAWTLKGSYTSASWDHRAFLYWRRESVAVMPVSVFSSTEQFSGAIVLNISSSKITERGRITHKIKNRRWNPNIRRNAIIGKVNLWSMSTDILQVNNIRKLKKVSSQVAIV